MTKKIVRNLSTPESRSWWARAKEVSSWPDWKRAGINVAQTRSEPRTLPYRTPAPREEKMEETDEDKAERIAQKVSNRETAQLRLAMRALVLVVALITVSILAVHLHDDQTQLLLRSMEMNETGKSIAQAKAAEAHDLAQKAMFEHMAPKP